MKRAVAVSAAPTAAANPTQARVIHFTASRRVIASGSEAADARALVMIFGSRAGISDSSFCRIHHIKTFLELEELRPPAALRRGPSDSRRSSRAPPAAGAPPRRRAAPPPSRR